MTLSKLKNPQALNQNLQSGAFVKDIREHDDGYNKLDRNGWESTADRITSVIDATKNVSDALSNALGTRAPMYVIGEIPADTELERLSDYTPSAVSGLSRAVSYLSEGSIQDGVIIDGIGDVDGQFSVEFTKNPTYFVSSQTTDQRYRVPATLTMTVMVSNYLSDNLLGSIASGISALDPTGLLGDVQNIVAYGGYTRSQYALLELRNLMEIGQPFTVYTPHGIYENMLIKSLNPSTDGTKMDMLYCVIEFQELILYTPYAEDVSVVPARKGIDKVREGWTEKAAEKAAKLS